MNKEKQNQRYPVFAALVGIFWHTALVSAVWLGITVLVRAGLGYEPILHTSNETAVFWLILAPVFGVLNWWLEAAAEKQKLKQAARMMQHAASMAVSASVVKNEAEKLLREVLKLQASVSAQMHEMTEHANQLTAAIKNANFSGAKKRNPADVVMLKPVPKDDPK